MLPPIPPDDLLAPFAETDWRYCRAIAERGDTYLHLPTLRALVNRSWDVVTRALIDSDGTIRHLPPRPDVVEFGVRHVCTTWAFLAARPRSLVSVDIEEPPPGALDACYAAAQEESIDFRFVKADTLTLEPIPCDLLFIDTLHTAAQLRGELNRHASACRRFIAFHDTMSFGFVGEDGTRPGLQEVIEELVRGELDASGRWELRWHDERCNGLAIVERVE